MRLAKALHIGVASPLAKGYFDDTKAAGWAWDYVREQVQGYAERSVMDMQKMCERYRVETEPPLLNCAATVGAFSELFFRTLPSIGTDGLLVISFAGHGRLLTDDSGDEADGCDTAWILYDAPLRDDDLRRLLREVPATCTVIVVGDCCNAGGIELSLQKLCTSNPRSVPEPAPPSSRVYLSRVDKGNDAVPGHKDPTFPAELLESLIKPEECKTYEELRHRFKRGPLNYRHVIRCRPESVWGWRPFA